MPAIDLRQAVRALVRRPAFAVTAVALVALGAGANAAVFAVVRGVLLRPLPFTQPDRLVAVWPRAFVANQDLTFWRTHVTSLEHVAGIAPGWLMALTDDDGEPLRVTGARVTDSLFGLLGAAPALGRTLAEGDGAAGRDRVAVLSDGLWRRRFGADPGVVGRQVRIDGVEHAVVGVMPPGFEMLGLRTDLWVPLWSQPGTPEDRTSFAMAVGRLRPGATAASASRELAALRQDMQRAFGYDADWGRTLRAEALGDVTSGPVRTALLVLLAAVGVVLLLAATNLATLTLGRSIERSHEVAVRTAVGASRGRVVAQLLLEQGLLAVAGALVGLGLARLLLPALVRRIPPDVPRQAEIALDGTVFAAVLGATTVLTAVAALVPALLAARSGVQPLLAQRQGTAATGRQRALGVLVAAQVALAAVLGGGAGLMLRSMWRLQQVDPGFEPSGVLAFRLQTTATYRALSTGLPYYARIGERLAALPGVRAVGAAAHLPLGGYAWTIPVRRADRPVPPGTSPPAVGWRFVWGDYFQAMRIPLLAGRLFTTADTTTAAPVAILNERLARTLFGSPAAAVGQRVAQQGGGRSGETVADVVGVVGDVRHEALDTPPASEIFRPLEQTFMFPMQIVLRVDGDPAALAGPVRQAAYAVDATVPVADLQPLPAMLSGTLGRPRLIAWLLGVFATAGLALCVIGLYGLVAVRVRQRQREFGIRLALGATPASLAAATVAQGLVLAGIGVLVGVPAALGLTRFMRGVIYGVSASDPLTFVALPLVLVFVAALACYVPARRAGRVDPVRVLAGDAG
ncbi:MAG: ABC transporter permease [Vicinamibacterales bacterium]